MIAILKDSMLGHIIIQTYENEFENDPVSSTLTENIKVYTSKLTEKDLKEKLTSDAFGFELIDGYLIKENKVDDDWLSTLTINACLRDGKL